MLTRRSDVRNISPKPKLRPRRRQGPKTAKALIDECRYDTETTGKAAEELRALASKCHGIY